MHASLLTVRLLEDHVVRHNGQWPRSWADLEALPPPSLGMFRWPEDSREVQRYVAIDFAADPRRLAKQGVEEFEAVRAIGPYYPFKDSAPVKSLLRAIRETANKSERRRSP